MTEIYGVVAQGLTKLNAYFFDVEETDGTVDWAAVALFYGGIALGIVLAAVSLVGLTR